MMDLFSTPQPEYELRDYQAAAVEAAHNFCRYRTGNGYIKAPGGSGKSVMIAKLAELLYDEGHKLVILARNEKLLRQNKAKFADRYQHDIGIYCAGIGEKDASKRITIASGQSIVNQTIDGLSFALVDECDEIPDEKQGQYWQFFEANGLPRIIGFTATPYRTATGKLKWGEEIIAIPIKPLIDAGHLVPPFNKVGTTLDLSHIEINAGEYNKDQIASVYDDPELLAISMEKLLNYSQDRRHVLVFGQSLRHCDALASALEALDKRVITVSGDTDKTELSLILNEFERGEHQYLINCQLLTVGIDLPCIDMIALLMATKSKRKFEQAVYRGTRPYEGKKDFLLLDMGNNLSTHGPLGSPYKEKNKTGASESVGRICPQCESFMESNRAKECSDCGFVFPEPEKALVKHAYEADTKSSTYYGQPDVQTHDVTYVAYKQRKSKAGNPMIVVEYHCDYGQYGTIAEFLLPHHESQMVTGKVLQWFKDRGKDMMPPLSGYTMEDLIWHMEKLPMPKQIVVNHGEEFPRIVQCLWDVPDIDDEIPF